MIVNPMQWQGQVQDLRTERAVTETELSVALGKIKELEAEIKTLRGELMGKHQDIELACHAKAEAAWKPVHDILEKHLDKSLAEVKTLREENKRVNRELIQMGIKIGGAYGEIEELKQELRQKGEGNDYG